MTEQQRGVQQSMVGRVVKVLFEKKGRVEGQLIGKSDYLHAVHAEADDAHLGQIRSVEIVTNMTNSLTGRLID